MGNTAIIFKRELGAYFNSALAYIAISLFLLISGYLFFNQVFLVGEATMRDFLGITPLIFIFFAPALAMRMLAEEKRAGTLELLITMPIGDWEVVLGKFLAGLMVLAVAVALTLAYPLTLSFFGDLDWGTVSAGYLGLVLMGGSYLAIGLMASSWTKNQVIAYLIAIAITLPLFLVGKLLPLIPASLAPVVEYISLDFHFSNISKGVIDSRDLIYYFSLIGGCLLLAVQSLDSRRWR